jgi:hypothetical protein
MTKNHRTLFEKVCHAYTSHGKLKGLFFKVTAQIKQGVTR